MSEYEEMSRNNGNYFNNAGFQAASSLQIRLDTSSIIRQIELYLRGKTSIIHIVNNQPEEKEVDVGTPKANEQGIQSIMMFVENILNPQVVQGNWERDKNNDDYGDYLCRQRKNIARHLMINLHDYDIKEKEYRGVISTIFAFIEPFTSRLNHNKERESYAQTIRSVENTSNTMRGKGFGSNMPFMRG